VPRGECPEGLEASSRAGHPSGACRNL